MRILFGVLGLIVALSSWGQQASIRLHDGSILHGEVIGLANSVYTLRGESFGVIKVPQSNIRTIDYRNNSAPPSGL